MVPPPAGAAEGSHLPASERSQVGWEIGPAGRRQVGGWWAATAAYALLLLVMSVIPIRAEAPRHADKLVHFCEYLLLAWLLLRSFRAERPSRLRAWLWATAYGALIELIQAFLPWRSAELADALANAIGAGLGVWISWWRSVSVQQ